ncbi:MAG: dihydrofolate reductase [Candidatus Wildermuthbacteria bacterium]|nr:dihydrofolate reductase [Candidatus Wildermuthbacteria bacterium]
MTAFIIAALTADGFIAKNVSHTPMEWTSKEDKRFFMERTKQAGVVVFGQNTYETIGKPLPGRHNVVYSRDKAYEGVEVTQKEPLVLLEDLEKRGFKEVAVCGGSAIYTMFMEAGVVNTLYLSIEPVLFGKGMTLFNKELDKKLQLVSIEKLGENTILVEYNII